MKRRLLLVLGLFLCLTVLSGVYASEEGKLLIWADDTVLYLTGSGKEIHPKISHQYRGPELNFREISNQLSIVGPSGKGPDILIGAHDWLGQLVVNGLIEPVDLGTRRRLCPVAISAFSWEMNFMAFLCRGIHWVDLQQETCAEGPEHLGRVGGNRPKNY